MRWPGPSVPRLSTLASGLGWLTLGVLFIGFFIGGAVSGWEALGLTGAVAILAAAGWLFIPSAVPMRRIGTPALAFLITLGIVALTAAPIAAEIARRGLYAAVGGGTLSIAPIATLVEVAKLAGLGCAFLCGMVSGGGRGAPARISDAAIALTAAWAAWSLVLFVSGGSQARLGAPLLSPNTAATLLSVGLLLAIGRLLVARDARLSASHKRWELVWRACAAVLITVALFLTQSRAGLASAILGGAGLAASWLSTRPAGEGRVARRWLGLGGLTLVLMLVMESGRGLWARLPALSEAAADRREIFGIYWRAFLDAPLFGGGLGSATYVTKLGMTSENYEALWNIQSAHNWALQWLAEGGLAATAPMVLAVASVLVVVFRGLDARNAPVLLPLLFVDFLVLAHGLSDFALQIPAFALYWSFLLGLQIAVSARPSPRRSRRPAVRSEENMAMTSPGGSPSSSTVAVVIAAFNAADRVAVAIRSALAQPEASEVWVVDDASSDATAEAAEACDDGTGRLHVVRSATNGGPAAARNIALDATRADWVCVLDADDWFAPGRLTKLLAAAAGVEMIADTITPVAETDAHVMGVGFEGPGVPVEWCNLDLERFIDGSISRRGRNRQELAFIKPLMSTVFLRRHRIRYAPRLRLGEDFLLYAQVLAHGGRLRLGPPCGYLALTRPDSLSGRHSIEDLAAFRDCANTLERIRTLSPLERLAIRRHWRSIDDRLQWRRLIEAVKARDVGAGLATFHDPSAALNLVGRLGEQAWVRTRRRFSGTS